MATARRSAKRDQFTVVLEDIRAHFRVFGESLDGVKADLGELKTDVSDLKADVSGLKTDVSSLKTDVSSLKTDVSGLKTDVSNLRTDVSSLKTELHDFKTEVRGGFARVDGDLVLLRTAVLDNSRAISRVEKALEKKVDRDEVVAMIAARRPSR